MVVHNLWSYVKLKYQFMAHTADYGTSAIRLYNRFKYFGFKNVDGDFYY